MLQHFALLHHTGKFIYSALYPQIHSKTLTWQ